MFTCLFAKLFVCYLYFSGLCSKIGANIVTRH